MIHRYSLLLAGLLVGQPIRLSAQTVLSVGNVPAYPGATVSVPVSLRQAPAAVVAAQFDVTYNAAKVSAAGSVATARLAAHTVKSREIAPGLRRTLVYSLSNSVVTGSNGPIVRMPFVVSPDEKAGSGPLVPANVLLARPDGTSLPVDSARAGAIFLRPVNLLPDGSAQFFLPSTNEQRYVIQATTNLVHWATLQTNTASGDFLNVLDPDAAGHPHRFYRWELVTP